MCRVSDNKGKTMQKHWKHALYATIAICGLYGQMVMAQGPIEKIPRAGTQARYHVGDSIQAGSGAYGSYQITGRGWYRDGQKIGDGQTYRPTAADAGHKIAYAEEIRDPKTGKKYKVFSYTVEISDGATALANKDPALSTGVKSPHVGETVSGIAGQYEGTIVGGGWFIGTRTNQMQKVASGSQYKIQPNDAGKLLAYREEVRSAQGRISVFSTLPVRIAAKNETSPTPGNDNDICAAITARQTPLIAGMDIQPLPDTPLPEKGVATLEPTYKTCLVRITDTGSLKQNNFNFRRNIYSRSQAFNADNSKMILMDQAGFWYLYDAQTGKEIRALKDFQGAEGLPHHIAGGNAEPQWHASDPNTLYFMNENGVGMKLFSVDIGKNQVSLAADMGAEIRKYWNVADIATTRSEGSPSSDGRYWCLLARDSTSWKTHGVFVWDMQQQQIIGHLDTPDGAPDHVSMSPSGEYCVISGDDQTGTRVYDRKFQNFTQLHQKSEHSDIALNKAGQDVYVSIDYQSSGGDIFMTNLKTGKQTVLFPSYLNGTATAIHVSGKAFRKPGWVLISTYAEHKGDQFNLRRENRQWLHRKIFAVSLEDTPKIYSIANADSEHFYPQLPEGMNNSANYWLEPHATVNQDFTRILFNSGWNRMNGEVDNFMIALPKNALPD